MTPDVAERAFDPFFTTKDIGKGIGLGLSRVFGFVRRQSGGYIDIESAPRRGTTVRLYLPRLQAGARETAEPADAPEAPGCGGWLARRGNAGGKGRRLKGTGGTW